MSSHRSVSTIGPGVRWQLIGLLILAGFGWFVIEASPAEGARKPYRGESTYQLGAVQCQEQSNGKYKLSTFGKGWANRIPAEDRRRRNTGYYLKVHVQIDRIKALGQGWGKWASRTYTSRRFNWKQFPYWTLARTSLVVGPQTADSAITSSKITVTLKRNRYGLPDKTYWSYAVRSRNFNCDVSDFG